MNIPFEAEVAAMLQQQFLEFVAELLPSWRASQRKVLGLCVAAMVMKRCCTLSALARALPRTTEVIYRLKRVARFVDNPRLDLLAGWQVLARRAAALRPEGYLPILLDDTGVRDWATVLTAAVPWHGRALPIANLAFAANLIKHSTWKLRLGLIQQLRQGLGEHAPRMVIVADRGFAASHFFRHLRAAQIHFVVRVPAKVYVQWAGLRTLLGQLEMQPGCRHWLPDLRYGPRQARLNILIVWRRQCQEPWILATSLDDPQQIYHLYQLRMRIEAFFKDSKQHFHLEACRLHTGARISTLAFILTLALWWLAFAAPVPPGWESQARTRGKLSYLTIAIEWLQDSALQLLLLSPAPLVLNPGGAQSG